MILALGTDPDGTQIALIDHKVRVRIINSQTHLFEVGDKIGWSSNSDYWAGTIVVSEPDPAGWHLAWIDENQPGKTFHWRGRTNTRDTRWYMPDPYVISETP